VHALPTASRLVAVSIIVDGDATPLTCEADVYTFAGPLSRAKPPCRSCRVRAVSLADVD